MLGKLRLLEMPWVQITAVFLKVQLSALSHKEVRR